MVKEKWVPWNRNEPMVRIPTITRGWSRMETAEKKDSDGWITRGGRSWHMEQAELQHAEK